ncbi:polysaccharide export outer membrane protein [Altererythrobacter atlanticus]|uniref:Polysaccharide biosynthesis/export protein n=1 Tax=Croceibacterium atlanticum TaxID=1267766 RepID=A0A0F7KQI0_9SPHN|nr:polysaccharide biosynthesis/export family protein [Croceibacterium atlanticum]AKH42788.1 Polysaccharide biosynthesis/export protein [Croceibacterium atlanticum]MBB5731568.1 polysaccharide export outer membrane protein [Croceibacterium atlanticum]
MRGIAALPGRIMALALACLLAACTSNSAPPGDVSYAAPEYRLAAGDELRITVFGEEALSKEYAISSTGVLSFPLIGEVAASGQTVTELTRALTDQLGNGYINDPRINIEVLNYRPYYILGEVSRPGQFPYANGLTVVQAVALAGGYTYRADKGKIFITRDGASQEEAYELDEGRKVYVSPGDTIRVGERYF